MTAENSTFSESPSQDQAKCEVMTAFYGADHIDMVAMHWSLRRHGLALNGWHPLNREENTTLRFLYVSFKSIDCIEDTATALIDWAHRRFKWVGKFALTFWFCDESFSFTIRHESGGLTKVYDVKHLAATERMA